MFHVGVSGSNSFGFLSVSPTVFKLSFKIQTGKNKTKKVGFQNNALVYFDKISCTCAAQPCACAAQH